MSSEMSTAKADVAADNVDISEYTDNSTKSAPMDQSGTTPAMATNEKKTYVSQSDSSEGEQDDEGALNDDLTDGGNLVIVAPTAHERMEAQVEAEMQRQREEQVLYYIDDVTFSTNTQLRLFSLLTPLTKCYA